MKYNASQRPAFPTAELAHKAYLVTTGAWSLAVKKTVTLMACHKKVWRRLYMFIRKYKRIGLITIHIKSHYKKLFQKLICPH
jgi:hypothetical protein